MTEDDFLKDTYSSCDVFYKWAIRGRIIGQIKEKYNTSRWYAYLGDYFSLNDIFYPCYYYYQFPKWIRKIDTLFFNTLFGWLIGPVINKWRIFCYKQAYKECSRKYPLALHVIDYGELIGQEEKLIFGEARDKWNKLVRND